MGINMGENLAEWVLNNPVPRNMVYADSAYDQVKKFWVLAKDLGAKVSVVGHHTSKSIKLPVVEMVFPNKGKILLRDNFHSLEIAVLWDYVPDLEYRHVYRHVGEWVGDGKYEEQDGWKWYLNQVSRCEEYSWKGWSDEELNDPRITRVQVSRSDGSKYWVDTTPDKKEMWLKRMTDPAWYYRYSGGCLLHDGEFGPGVALFMGCSTFLEGISDLIPYGARETYRKGKKDFTVSTDWDRVQLIIENILNSTAC